MLYMFYMESRPASSPKRDKKKILLYFPNNTVLNFIIHLHIAKEACLYGRLSCEVECPVLQPLSV